MWYQLAQAAGVIIVWEMWKYIKQAWKEAGERSKGLRWECSECETKFASNDKSILDRWVLDHVKAHIEAHDPAFELDTREDKDA